MRKHVLIFICVSLLLLGLGYALFWLFIVEDTGQDSFSPQDSLSNPTDSQQAGNRSAEAPEKMRILSTVGTVEKKTGAGSKWIPVMSGDELGAKDSIKTEKNARARLAAEDNSEIEIQEQSEIDLDNLSSSAHSFELKRGQLKVSYRKNKQRTVRVSSAETGAVAEAEAGDFVIQNHKGTVSLATTKGETKFTSNDETVVVASGQYSTATKGRSPGPAAPIPLEVMLRVAKTNLKNKNTAIIVIQGQSDPGAHVLANGVDAQMEPDGTFEASIPRSPEQKQIRLTASTPWGSRTKSISVDSDKDSDRIRRARVRWGRQTDSQADK